MMVFSTIHFAIQSGVDRTLVLKGHLALHDANTEKSSLRTTGSVLQTPPASPHRERGYYRILYTPKRVYSNLAGAEPRKRKKRPNSKLSGNLNDTSLSDRLSQKSIELNRQNDIQQADDDQLKSTYHSNPDVDDSSSYHADSAYTVKAMSSILYECARVNFAIALYGVRTSDAVTTTKPDRIRKYVDDLAKVDYGKTIYIIRRGNALAMGRGVQSRYNETIYWSIILKGAALVDHTKLPTAKGPADGFTMAEKAATKKFMEDAGYALGAENQRQCRIFWKNLFEIREAGIDKNVSNPLVDTIMNWEAHHRSDSKGDLRHLSGLEAPQVAERLKVQGSSWNNAKNEWAFTGEEENFKEKSLRTFPPEVLCTSHHGQLISESGRDKSTFTFLLPRDSSSLFVCSIVPVSEGDFLGIFAGKIRFSEDFSATHGIPGAVENLWLDYSQVTGTMNQMLVAEPNGSANVRLQWQVVDDDSGTESYTSWKVFVKAIAS
ncbi:hypothetical protein N7478_010218 [Penicillium angulare]|uniref:uncharacterized protein n=1 Tax=Penicillium angulare TaxID=116970 RepID=UPI00253FB201|nr:uncharacterized protein N7478_010218 [Penicillium angulare]KAJ5267410.1 hypothetical protein N7478_010218 [Penicillium angulare]